MSLSRFHDFLNRVERRRRISRVPWPRLKDRGNPIEIFDAAQFKSRFHLDKDTVLYICKLLIIKDHLSPGRRQGVSLPSVIELTTVLRFYATGSFQLCIADLQNVSQSTVSKLVGRVFGFG